MPSRVVLLPNSKRLLFVDDDPELRILFTEVGKLHGYEILLTERANDFEIAYNAFKPDVVAFDLSMPGADAVELMQFLTHRNCTEPVLLFGNPGDEGLLGVVERLGRAWGLDIVATLTKPINAHSLGRLLRALPPPP